MKTVKTSSIENTKPSNSKPSLRKLRIIAGIWRSRHVLFRETTELRPTADRIRETLFNWLAPDIVGAKCLDLFAGTGILGFEAISRGASSVVAIEKNPATIKMIDENKTKLAADKLQILHNDVVYYLNNCCEAFDVIFLDPPYANNALLIECINLIVKRKILKSSGFLYFESNFDLQQDLSKSLNILKAKKAGKVYYYLATLLD